MPPFKGHARMPFNLGAYEQPGKYRNPVSNYALPQDLPEHLMGHYKAYVKSLNHTTEEEQRYRSRIYFNYQDNFQKEMDKLAGDPHGLGILAAMEPEIARSISALDKSSPGARDWGDLKTAFRDLKEKYIRALTVFRDDEEIRRSRAFGDYSNKALKVERMLDERESDNEKREREASEREKKAERDKGQKRQWAEAEAAATERRTREAAQRTFERAKSEIKRWAMNQDIRSNQERDWTRKKNEYVQARSDAIEKGIVINDAEIAQAIGWQDQNMSYLIYSRKISSRFSEQARIANPRAGDLEILKGLLAEYEGYYEYLTLDARGRREGDLEAMRSTVKELSGKIGAGTQAATSFQASQYVDPVEKYCGEVLRSIIGSFGNEKYEDDPLEIAVELNGKKYCFPPRGVTNSTPVSKYIWCGAAGELWLAVSDEQNAKVWLSGLTLDSGGRVVVDPAETAVAPDSVEI